MANQIYHVLLEAGIWLGIWRNVFSQDSAGWQQLRLSSMLMASLPKVWTIGALVATTNSNIVYKEFCESNINLI